jgi:hypothetical protein
MEFFPMRRLLLVAALAVLLPAGAFAQTEPSAPPAPVSGASASPALVVAGLVGAAVVADIFTGGALSAPLLRLIGWEAAPVVRAAAPAAAAAAPAAAAPAAAAAAAPAAAATPAAVVTRPWWRFW